MLISTWEIWYRGRLPYGYFDFDVYFCNFFSFVFLGQIWSQNLKFFRLNGIWYRDTLPCTYFDFHVFFFKIFVIHIFFGKIWSHKNQKFAKLNEIWYRVTLYIQNNWLQRLLFQISFHSYSYIPFIHILRFFKLTEIWYIGRLLYAYFDFIVYFFNFFVISIRSGKFSLKTWSSSNWMKCRILMFIFSKF